MLTTGSRLKGYKSISFQLGLMIDMTKFYILIAVKDLTPDLCVAK